MIQEEIVNVQNKHLEKCRFLIQALAKFKNKLIKLINLFQEKTMLLCKLQLQQNIFFRKALCVNNIHFQHYNFRSPETRVIIITIFFVKKYCWTSFYDCRTFKSQIVTKFFVLLR